MAVRRALVPVDPTGTVHIQELDDTAMNSIHSTYAEYVYSLYPATTLTVVGSGGNLPGLPMTDTRYQAGASTTRVDRFATEAETQNISVVTVNYSRISQSFASNTTPVDTNSLRYPLYLHNTGSGNDIDTHFRAMSSQDFYDTFVLPAISIINNSVNSVGDYYISTSLTPAAGSILVSSTPVYTDTRANLAAYSSGSIPETQDQPSTINNYYLHVYGTSATDDNDLPLYLDANDEQIKQYTLAQWAATLGPWLQYHYTNLGDAPSYEINGIGTTQGSVMLNTILSPTGTGYSTRYVNTNDYRTQEFPTGTPVTANTYELKKFTPVNSFGALDESISYTLSSTGEVLIEGAASVSISYSTASAVDVPSDADFAGSLQFTLSSTGEVLIEGIASVDTSYSLASEGEVLIEGIGDVSTSYSLFASTSSVSLGEFSGTLPYTLSADGDVLIQGTVAVDTSYTLSASTDAPSDGDFAGSLPFTLDSDGVVLIEGIGDVSTSYTVVADGDVLIQGTVAVDTSYSLASEGEVVSLIEGTASVSTSYSLASEGEVVSLIEGTASVSTSYSLASEGELGAILLDTLDNPNAYGTSASDYFGYSTAMYGDYAIVGAPDEDDAGGASSGKVYIFNSANGQLLHTLDNPNAYGSSAGDNFGRDVDIDGNYAIIGAAGESDAGGLSSGKAYIFYVANGTLLHTLDNPNAYDTSLADSFGDSVAISGTKAIVGAYNEDDAGGTQSGKAYIFDVITGNLQVTLDNPNAYGTSASDYFSSGINAVDINGDYAIVGAYAEDDAGGLTSGKAYIFNSANGQLLHTLDNPNTRSTSADDFFGYSVAINDNFAVVSAINERGADNAGGGGVVYVFDTANGSLLYTFDNPNIDATSFANYFGFSISLSGNYVAIGSRESADNATYTFSGVVYIYDLTSGTLIYTVKNPNAYDTPAGDTFGDTVSIFGNRMIVGAPAEGDAGGTASGKAYIYELQIPIEGTASVSISYSLASEGEAGAILLDTLDNPNAYGTSANDLFGFDVAIYGNYAIVGAYLEDDAGGTGSGKAYIFNSANGQLLHTLDNPNDYDTSASDWFGQSVAISNDYAIVGAPLEDSFINNDGVGIAYIFSTANGSLLHTLDHPNAYGSPVGDEFGISVDIDENYAIVGAHLEDDASGLASGKAYIFHVANGALAHTLDNPNPTSPSTNDLFGHSVSISGNYAIVGAYKEEDANASDSGKAYIFHVANGALAHTLDNPNPYGGTAAEDWFGKRVSISGNYAIVGAPREDDAGGTESGKAYIFHVANGALAHTLDNPNAYSTSANDNFGDDVSISGNYAIVGAWGEGDSGGTQSGKAYIFSVITGELLYTVNNPNAYSTSSTDRFGRSVAISGNRIISGAYIEDDAGGVSSGKAYIFEIPIQVTLETTLDNPNAYSTSANDSFGRSVAISGNYTIAGAYEDDAGGNNSGKAYIFNSSNGQLLHTLDNPNAYGTSANDLFGHSVDISDNYAIVGTSSEDDAGGENSGKAYIFHVANGALAHTLDNPNAYSTSFNDYFGQSVGIDGDYAIVGAYSEDDAGGTDSGKAYIFHVANGALAHTLDNPNAYGTSAVDRFGYSVDISGNYAIVGAHYEEDAGGTYSGKAYIFNVATGALVHTLDNPNAYGTSDYDYFGHSVAISGNYAIVGAYAENYAGGTDTGKAYIFNVATGDLVHTLDNPNAYDTEADDYFGWHVNIDSNYAIVGAYQEDDAGGVLSGKAYLFDVTNGDLLATIDNPNAYDTSYVDRFGYSVAISGNYAVAGAYGEDDAGGSASGKAYIFKIT